MDTACPPIYVYSKLFIFIVPEVLGLLLWVSLMSWLLSFSTSFPFVMEASVYIFLCFLVWQTWLLWSCIYLTKRSSECWWYGSGIPLKKHAANPVSNIMNNRWTQHTKWLQMHREWKTAWLLLIVIGWRVLPCPQGLVIEPWLLHVPVPLAPS